MRTRIMYRALLLPVVWIVLCGVASGQSQALKLYLGPQLPIAEGVAKAAPAERSTTDIMGLMPHVVAGRFVLYVTGEGGLKFGDFLDAVDRKRLNKMLANAPGTGGTALASRVAVPAVIGAAIEYGSILQQTTGTTTTLRANALGLARLLVGAEQFPYCPQIASNECAGPIRLLRNVSGAVAFESVRAASETPAVTPTAAQLFTDEFRVASASVRIDLTPSNNLDDPKYVKAWAAQMETLAKHPAAEALSKTVADVIPANHPVYAPWMKETFKLLKEAPSDSFYDVLESRLNVLVNRWPEEDPDFARSIVALRRAHANYFEVRDDLIRQAHVHKASFEYTNLRPQNQPSMSNVRLIYSHQPTLAPVLVTLNTAATFNHEVPAGTTAKQFRDVQFAAQLDRRIQNVPQFGQAVLTLAAYYQWMREDALIKIPAGTLAPGTGIVLPAEASTLLGTKGHIGVVQGKFSVPLSDALKVPLSITWATRRELVKEKDVRGQIGLTLDLDSLFR